MVGWTKAKLGRIQARPQWVFSRRHWLREGKEEKGRGGQIWDMFRGQIQADWQKCEKRRRI